jgi:transcriptional regulator with XRE-family HTH domain
MGRGSTKENKNVYQEYREELNLSREKASELMEVISKEKIEKIESEKTIPRADEVLIMADAYNKPELRNYYCAHECPIGKLYKPEVKIKDNLSTIVLEMIASLNSMKHQQERFIEISADGVIENEEIQDFVHIQEELDRITMTVETLQIWSDKMLKSNKIDMELYNSFRNKKR